MKKILYSLVIILFFVFIPKASASEVIFGAGAYFNIGTTIRIDDTHNSIPYTNSFSSNPLNLGAIGLVLSPSFSGASILEAPTYNYLIFEICTSGTVRLNVSNSSTTGSFLVSGGYNGFDLGTTGTVSSNNYTCYNNLYQIPIGKWKLDENSGMFEVDSYFNFERVSSSGNFFKITKVFLSDEDYLVTYRNQAQLVDKLNSVQTAITNMQNSINSNANANTQNIINNQNSNTQNIINNQNSNAQQAHTDAQNTQNKIDSLKDDTVNSNTGKSFFDNFSDNSHGLSGIITAPLNIIRQLINVNPTSCSALSTTYHNKTISMPCGAIFWGHTGFSEFNVFYNMVVGGAFCYLIIKDLFLTIEKLKDPDNDKVEVMDL